MTQLVYVDGFIVASRSFFTHSCIAFTYLLLLKYFIYCCFIAPAYNSLYINFLIHF